MRIVEVLLGVADAGSRLGGDSPPLANLPAAGFTTLALLLLAAAILRGLSWGSGIHIQFARRFLEEDLPELPPDLQSLLRHHEDQFLYGNIAPDIISYKNYGGLKNHCHNWNIRERLREHAESPADEAFIWGYLCHLAADVVAHQHFVPFHIVYELPPRVFGHLYWEARYDGTVAPDHWQRIDSLRLDRALRDSDQLILKAVPKRAFPYSTNKLIFNHVLLARSRRSWRKIIDGAIARRPAPTFVEHFVDQCLEECSEQLRRVFRESDEKELISRDPNGHAELAETTTLRKQLRAESANSATALEASRAAAEERFGLPARDR